MGMSIILTGPPSEFTCKQTFIQGISVDSGQVASRKGPGKHRFLYTACYCRTRLKTSCRKRRKLQFPL